MSVGLCGDGIILSLNTLLYSFYQYQVMSDKRERDGIFISITHSKKKGQLYFYNSAI